MATLVVAAVVIYLIYRLVRWFRLGSATFDVEENLENKEADARAQKMADDADPKKK